MILKKVEKILDERDYVYQEWNGCFDIVARRRDDVCLLKVLDNVDSIQEEQANNLKMLSHNICAFTAIIGTHTRREMLNDDVVYERYGIPAITTDTLSNILDNNIPKIYRTRGGLFNNINSEEFKKSRKKHNLTQKQLAEKVGVTKKFIYEHEKTNMLSDREIVIKLEKMLNASISTDIDISSGSFDQNDPVSLFEKEVSKVLKGMGFSTDLIHQTPFNIIAKEKFMVLSDVEDNEKRIMKNMNALKSFSEITKNPAIIISKNDDIESELPVVDFKDLEQLNISDLKRILKRW